MNPAVFLDRDGTLLVDVGYLDRIERLELFPWSVDAVRLLNHAGFRVVIVTNQAGVARGIIDESFVREAHQFIGQLMDDDSVSMTCSGGEKMPKRFDPPATTKTAK